MARLPVISGAEAIKAFHRTGWRVVRQSGSHVVMVKEGEEATLSIPLHHELKRVCSDVSSETRASPWTRSWRSCEPGHTRGDRQEGASAASNPASHPLAASSGGDLAVSVGEAVVHRGDRSRVRR